MKRVLILGATGMLGNAVTKVFLENKDKYLVSITAKPETVFLHGHSKGTEKQPVIIANKFQNMFDNLADFSRQRYSPTIHTFMKKTETGYAEDGPTNASSLTVQPRWDFSNSATSKKFGTAQQVYRHKRAYVPTGGADTFDDGYELVASRTKIRGRGKALQLKFTGETGKDAHLLGWSLHYEGIGEV